MINEKESVKMSKTVKKWGGLDARWTSWKP